MIFNTLKTIYIYIYDIKVYILIFELSYDYFLFSCKFAPYVGNQDLNSLYRFIKSNDHFITTMLIFSSTKIYVNLSVMFNYGKCVIIL